MCDVAFGTYASISQLEFLTLVLKDIKQITTGQKIFRCSVVDKVFQVSTCFPLPWKFYHVHKHTGGSAKPCKKDKLLKVSQVYLSKESDITMCFL